MKPDERFLKQPKSFWAYARSISESFGYTARGQKTVKAPNVAEVVATLEALQLESTHIASAKGKPTKLGRMLTDYFTYRADVLNNLVKPRLMNLEDAARVFHELKQQFDPPEYLLPMNKQKQLKKKPAYLSSIVNMLVHANAGGIPFDHNPMRLTTFTAQGKPLRTLARRLDGAIPTVTNPVAVWEVKEYYHTTTFGSRVADGIYESLLDGMELEELREQEGVDVLHYLMLDDYYTWWDCGRSYLCRVVDMLHMGYLDEVLVGREVVERLPSLVENWVGLVYARDASAP